MGTDEERLAPGPGPAEHGAEPVDPGVEPRLPHPLHQPVAGVDVHAGEGLAHDPGTDASELA